MAAVVLNAGAAVGADALRDWINARVAAKYQRVAQVIVYEDFPRNAAGKTLKREMRAPFWEGRIARSDSPVIRFMNGLPAPDCAPIMSTEVESFATACQRPGQQGGDHE